MNVIVLSISSSSSKLYKVVMKNLLIIVFFYASTNFKRYTPIEIYILFEKGKISFSYTDITITYDDGKVEHYSDNDIKNSNNVYWCNSHTKEIKNFYNALDKKEEFFISNESVLKTEKLINEIYKIGKLNFKKDI